MDTHEKIELDGHMVDPDRIDQFYDGNTGRRITDEEWDESQRRLREHEAADALAQEGP